MPLSIERARKDAKALHAAWRAGDADALKRAAKYFAPNEPTTLSRAQLVVARDANFTSWPELVRGAGATQNDLVAAARAGDVTRVHELLQRLTPMPKLLPAICINPIAGPEADVVECVELLIAAGADPNVGVVFKGKKYSCLDGAEDLGHTLLASLLRRLVTD